MKTASRKSNVLLLVLILLCLGAGSALFFPSFLSYESALEWAQARGYVGDDPQRFTPDYFASVAGRMRVSGGVLILVGLALLVFRKKLSPLLAGAIQTQSQSLGRLARDFRDFLTQALRTDGGWHWLALFGVVAAGVCLRLYYLSLPMRYDESATFMWYASQPFYVALSKYTAPNNHIFNTLLIHLSSQLFGDSIYSIRLPALLAGIALVPVSYLTFRYLYDKQTGLFTAGLVACSSFLVQYSTNARGYTLVALFFLLMLLCLARLRERREPACWLLVAVFGALAMYTILSSLYVLTIAAAWWLLSGLRGPGSFWERIQLKQALAASLAMVALTLILYTPVLGTMGWKALLANDYVSFGRQFPAGAWRMVAEIGQGWGEGLPGFAAALWILALGVWVYLHRRSARFRLWPVWAALGGVLPILLLHGRIPPLRTWVFLIPFFLGGLGLLLARVLDALLRRPGRAAAVVRAATPLALVLLLGGYLIKSGSVPLSTETGVLRDGPEIAALLREKLKPGDTVYSYCPANMPVFYYLHSQGRVLTEQIMYNPLNHDRVWLVAAPRYNCGRLPPPSIEELIKALDFEGAGFGPPVLVKAFSESSLYLVEKKK